MSARASELGMGVVVQSEAAAIETDSDSDLDSDVSDEDSYLDDFDEGDESENDSEEVEFTGADAVASQSVDNAGMVAGAVPSLNLSNGFNSDLIVSGVLVAFFNCCFSLP